MASRQLLAPVRVGAFAGHVRARSDSMKTFRVVLAGVLTLVTLAASGQAWGDDQVDYQAMTGAAREMARQVDFFQDVMTTDNTLMVLNDLYGQTLGLQDALTTFRQQA